MSFKTILIRTLLSLGTIFGATGFTVVAMTTQDTFQLISYGLCTVVTSLTNTLFT